MHVQRPGWRVAFHGSCSLVDLRWWAGFYRACVPWRYPALVPGCLRIPTHRAFAKCMTRRLCVQASDCALLWPSKSRTFTEVMLSYCIASAFPVGAEAFLLDTPPERESADEPPSTAPLTAPPLDTTSSEIIAAASSSQGIHASQAESGMSSTCDRDCRQAFEAIDIHASM